MIVIYIAAVVLANLSVAYFGPWISPINSLLLIGLDLTLRDVLHDRWSGRRLWLRMFGLIASAGAISYLLNPATGVIAIASVAAFALSGLADAAAYHLLRGRSYLQRSNGSNVAGAVVDSFVFPTIAFGAFLPAIVLGQIAAKVAGGLAWSLLLRRYVAAR